MTEACQAVSEKSRTAAISPSRDSNRRKTVPLPTPAAAATASMVTQPTPRSSTSRRAAHSSASRLRAASARSTGGWSAIGSSSGSGTDPTLVSTLGPRVGIEADRGPF